MRKSGFQSLVTILYSYLLISPTFITVKIPKNGISPKTLKWPNITPEDMRKFLGLIILMGQVKKENIRNYWSTDPTISTPIFNHTMSRNRFDSIWQALHFSYNSQQVEHSGGYSKFDPCMNIFFRNLGQYTAQNKNCHLMKQ